MNAKDLAVVFHEAYERLAPSFGYETREETRLFDENSDNGQLMIAVCSEILTILKTGTSETNERRIAQLLGGVSFDLEQIRNVAEGALNDVPKVIALIDALHVIVGLAARAQTDVRAGALFTGSEP